MTQIKTCTGLEGKACYQIAIGHGGAQRDDDLCREHYLEASADEFVTATVTAGKITDVRTQESVGQGGTVTLDPVLTDLAALVYAGLIDPKSVTDAGTAAGKSKTTRGGKTAEQDA